MAHWKRMAVLALRTMAILFILSVHVNGDKTKDPPPASARPQLVEATKAPDAVDPNRYLHPLWVDSENPAFERIRDQIREAGSDIVKPLWWDKEVQSSLKFLGSRITLFSSPGCTGRNESLGTLDCGRDYCEDGSRLSDIRSALLQAINPDKDYDDVNEKGPELSLYKSDEDCGEEHLLARAVIPSGTDVACFNFEEKLTEQIGRYTALQLEICPWADKMKEEAFWFAKNADHDYDWSRISVQDAEDWISNAQAEDMPVEWDHERPEQPPQEFKETIYEEQLKNARQKGKLTPEKNKMYPGTFFQA